MDSLGDETWDAVICGTGLPQSILALALSRSNKRILHLDPNDYYGEHEAAFSLQEAESWAAKHAASVAVDDTKGQDGLGTDVEERPPTSTDLKEQETSEEGSTSAGKPGIFKHASVWKHPEAEAHGLSFPRAYSLALAPQMIHTRSKLLEQLVSSRAYRQVEFLAVGSFFVYEAANGPSDAKLACIPSSREDVFSAQSIPARSKRSLMKFLKFVVDYDSEEQSSVWQGQGDKPLAEFLSTEFKLDETLRKYILALTLSLDGDVAVQDGLATIHRHLTSMGIFGPGFCAVYPKWGGISEIAQVACRAGAVGGGIYMLDTDMKMDNDAEGKEISLSLSNGVSVQTTSLISSQQEAAANAQTITRLVAVVNKPLQPLFEVVVEGAPTPAVAVIAFPANTTIGAGDSDLDRPAYAMVHSSETGECPAGQSVIYLTTIATPQSKQRLEAALKALLDAAAPSDGETPTCLYKLQYEQSVSPREPTSSTRGGNSAFAFPSPPLNLSLDDTGLDAVKKAWKLVMKDEGSDDQYMIFQDREGVGDDDDVYD